MSIDSRDGKPAPASTLDFLVKVAAVGTIFYAYIFLAGWAAISVFFSDYQIDIWSAGLPGYTFATIAFFPLFGPLLWVILFAALVALSVFVADKWFRPWFRPWFQKTVDWLIKWQKPSLGVLILIVITGMYFIGAHYGHWLAREQATNRGRVRLVFKTADRQPYEAALLEANEKGTLLLLTQTKDLVFVFLPAEDRNTKHAHVFVLARSDLSSVHILPSD